MIAEGTDPTKVTDEQCGEIIALVKAFAEKHTISQAAIGKAIGMKGSTISEVLSGKYRADPRAILLQLDAWLEREIKHLNAPTTTQFVWTSVAEEIRTVARTVEQLNTIGLCYGPDTSGIGKSMAARAIHEETPGSIFITVDKVHATRSGLIRTIAKAIWPGKTDRWVQRCGTIYDQIIEKLHGSRRLMIIDQIHNLRFTKGDDPFYTLADIYEATDRAPQLWLGTADIAAYFNRRSAKMDESLAQIRSRITITRDLMLRAMPKDSGGRGEPLFTVEDVRQMFARNKIRITPDGIRMLWQLACVPDSGSLRVCRNVVQVATIVGMHRAQTTISDTDLWAALRDCVQAGTYSDLRERIETSDGDTRRMKVG